MERNKTKERRTQLQGRRSQKVDKNKKEESKLATATKTKQPRATKQPKATQAKEEPTEDKFLTAKDLAEMANVKPGQLRRCLRLTCQVASPQPRVTMA